MPGRPLLRAFQLDCIRSTNDGEKWEGTSTGLTDPRIYSLAVSGKHVFAGTGGFPSGVGVFLSTDNGASWNATGLKNVQVNALAVSPGFGEGGGTNIFAGETGFFRSTDQADFGQGSAVVDQRAPVLPPRMSLFAINPSLSRGKSEDLP
jgi:hypothetical protein